MSVRKALTFAFLDRYASLVIGIGASMIQARLLTPADVAVFFIATVLLGFLASVRDLGAGQYPVREKDLDSERIRTIWTVQLGLGIVLACAVAAIYREPRMRDIMLVLALGYLIRLSRRALRSCCWAKLQSLTAAGLYSLANGLVAIFHRLVTDIINGVALSWFAKEARQSGDFSQTCVKATGYGTAIGWTFCLTIVFLAHPIIYMLFGPQWVGAVDLACVPAAAMAFGVPVTLCFSALVAAGSLTRVLKATAVSAVVILVPAAPGARFGLLCMGWANVLACASCAVLFMWMTQRVIGFQWLL